MAPRLTKRYEATMMRVRTAAAKDCNGNSGMPPPPLLELDDVEGLELVVLEELWTLEVDVVLEVVVVEDVLVVVDVLDEVLVVEVVEVVEVVDVVEVVVVGAVYLKVVVLKIVGGYAPHVAFTVYVPETQAEVPPATKSYSYAPVVASTSASPIVTRIFPDGSNTLTDAAVFETPGAGDTAPVTLTVCPDVYEGWSVATVIE